MDYSSNSTEHILIMYLLCFSVWLCILIKFVCNISSPQFSFNICRIGQYSITNERISQVRNTSFHGRCYSLTQSETQTYSSWMVGQLTICNERLIIIIKVIGPCLSGNWCTVYAIILKHNIPISENTMNPAILSNV